MIYGFSLKLHSIMKFSAWNALPSSLPPSSPPPSHLFTKYFLMNFHNHEKKTCLIRYKNAQFRGKNFSLKNPKLFSYVYHRTQFRQISSMFDCILFSNMKNFFRDECNLHQFLAFLQGHCISEVFFLHQINN